MFNNSFTLILLIIFIGLPSLLFLFLAIWNGHFDEMHQTAESIFEPDELRYARPWERTDQRASRIEQYGELVKNPSAEWVRWL